MIKTRQYDYSRDLARQELPTLIKKRELAKSMGISLSTVDRMIKDRRLPQPLRSQSGYATGWLKSTLIAWFNRQQPS
ncbi:helix-turn-helix transcriptional regulator [Vibrio mediterranei]|uniref:helix-turn-helix transcriptional regulator n=1 Tax=Vibrio mediterranei TaxID=689 RepID=UPI00406860C9